MKSVEIVEISKIIPVYKDGIEAERIQVVNFVFAGNEECGYNVITQKGLYEIGDKACYISPDYCISDIPIFDSFIRPNGDETKSRLGKNFRIRALKFNFSFKDSNDPIYSIGILMPMGEVNDYIKVDYNPDDLSEILGVTKYEEPETGGNGLVAGEHPSFMYRTDETDSAQLKGHVNRIAESEQELGLTIKVDGSSHSTYFRKIFDENGNIIWKYGICSRNQEKKLDQFYVEKYVDANNNEFHKYINPETKVKGWYNDSEKKFYTTDEIEKVEGLSKINREVKDSWVEVATKSGIIEKGLEYCKKYDVQLVFRGELNGQGLKGSGCKNNPDSNNKQNIKLFGIDSLESGVAIRQHYGDEHNLKKVCEECGLEYTPIIKTVKPKSYDELIEICEEIFKEEKTKGKLIEGVVIRTMYSNDLSAKKLSNEYDSKK